MAITIDGSANTIAGLAVGGLPDGIVDTDMIAANAVTAAKIPDEGITTAKLGNHAVIQVLHVSHGDTEATSSTSMADIDANFKVDITPRAASNKLLAFATIKGIDTSDSALSAASFDFYIGSTKVDETNNIGLGSDFANNQEATFSGFVSPNSTSAVTVKMQWANRQASEIRLNATTGGDKSTITVMEVVA